MRVIECNECGEPIQAADDDELVRNLGAHMAAEHDEEIDEDELVEVVEADAYEALDS